MVSSHLLYPPPQEPSAGVHLCLPEDVPPRGLPEASTLALLLLGLQPHLWELPVGLGLSQELRTVFRGLFG